MKKVLLIYVALILLLCAVSKVIAGNGSFRDVFAGLLRDAPRLILKTWRFKGLRVCKKPPYVCALIENAFPTGLIEVTRKPFKTNLEGLKPVFKSIAKMKIFKKMTSSHTDSWDLSGSSLQFQDVHVYTFVLESIVPSGFLIAWPGRGMFLINYLSELDRHSWRRSALDRILYPAASRFPCELFSGNLRFCAGKWGNYYPRIGFITRDSEVISSYLAGLRGALVANKPFARIVLSRYRFEPRTGHYIQMIAPKQRKPIKIGAGRISRIESNSLAKDAHYLFVHYPIMEACLECIPPRVVPARRSR